MPFYSPVLVGLIGQGAWNSWSGWASLVQFLDEAIYHVACKDTSVWSVHVTRSILSRGRVVQQWLELAQTILLGAIQSKDQRQFQGFDTRLCRIEWQVFFLEAWDQSIRPIVSFLHRNLVRSSSNCHHWWDLVGFQTKYDGDLLISSMMPPLMFRLIHPIANPTEVLGRSYPLIRHPRVEWRFTPKLDLF